MSVHEKKSREPYLRDYSGYYSDKSIISTFKKDISKRRRLLIKDETIAVHDEHVSELESGIDDESFISLIEDVEYADKFYDSQIIEELDDLPEGVTFIPANS